MSILLDNYNKGNYSLDLNFWPLPTAPQEKFSSADNDYLKYKETPAVFKLPFCVSFKLTIADDINSKVDNDIKLNTTTVTLVCATFTGQTASTSTV